MTGKMKQKWRGGFTLLEVVIACALVTTLLVVAVISLRGSLTQTQRESSMLTMDLSAKRSLGRISSLLGHALLPITTYPDHDIPVGRNNISTFQDLVNSEAGFATHGVEWAKILTRGTDIVPFAVPVDFGDDGDTLDSRLALELGIILPDGIKITAGQYEEADSLNVLDGSVGALHPSLAFLAPNYLGSDLGADDNSALDLSQPRFAETMAFDASQEGFGMLRFVPALTSGAEKPDWAIVDERKLSETGQGGEWDLNDDGQTGDVYAIGHLELTYVGRGGATINIPVSGPNILLQLNRDSPTWKPLFRLVRRGAQDAQSNNEEDGSAVLHVGGYGLLIDLLVFDQSSQKGSPLAFDARLPFLVRRHQTMVELRNMSNSGLLKEDG